MLPCLVGGLLLAVVAYLVLREVQFHLLHGHIPWLTGLCSMLPCLSGSFRLAGYVSDYAVAKRRPRWIAEVARTHGLEESSLEELTAIV